jgi:hypothetical protein
VDEFLNLLETYFIEFLSSLKDFSLDTDGDCSELVPLYVECGIYLIFPFEVPSGCDINEYRRKYPGLCIMGGIDKQ